MRRLITVAVLLFTAGVLYAEKPTSYTRADNVMCRIFFGAEVRTATTTVYAPFGIVAEARFITDDGGVRPVSKSDVLGPTRTTPYMPKESYNLLPAQLKQIFKELYQEGLNIDLEE